MKHLLICAAVLATAFASSAMAQSAKFTAAYNDSIDSTFVRSEACESTEEGICGETMDYDENEVIVEMSTIKLPNAKELMIGMSAQVALFTSTQAKGKRGSYSKAVATAEGGVSLHACNQASGVCYEAAPGYVTMDRRSQELEAVLAGVIEECNVDVTIDVDTETGSGYFNLADCVVLDEMIALGITTMSANHFNFLLPNLPQGDYTIFTKFQTMASASAEAECYYTSTEEQQENLGCEADDGNATGQAHAYIGKWMMTAQEVRAVKDENGEPMVID